MKTHNHAWDSLFPGLRAGAQEMGRRERRSCETRERLFRAAMNLFRDNGFHKTTVEDITDAADVGKGTFFNYFPSKEHVLGVLGEIQMAKYDRAVRIAHDQDARSALHWLFHALPAETGSSPDMVRSLMTVFMTSNEVREFLTNKLTLGRIKLGDTIRTAQHRGDIPSHHKPEELAFRFQQSAFGAMLLWTLQTPSPPLEKWLDQGFDFFWSAVMAPVASKNERSSRSRV